MLADPRHSNGKAVSELKKVEPAKHLPKRPPQDRCASVYPLGEVVAGFQLRRDLAGGAALVFRKILCILPLKILSAFLGVWLSSEVAVCSCLLVLGLAECQGHCDRTWAAVESDLDDVGDVIRSQPTLLRAICLH